MLDQTFCLTKPLRRRLIEDNSMSSIYRPENPPYKRDVDGYVLYVGPIGDGRDEECSDYRKRTLDINCKKVDGDHMELSSTLHRLERDHGGEFRKVWVKQDDGKHCLQELWKHAVQGLKKDMMDSDKKKLSATGTFCNDEDGKLVVMGEDDNEWQCTKLIHRTMWKELIEEDVEDFRLFMKYSYGSPVEEEYYAQDYDEINLFA